MDYISELEKDYYFNLVCIDEQNPLGFFVLANETVGSLKDVHDFVVKHFRDHAPEITKWELIPIRRDEIKV